MEFEKESLKLSRAPQNFEIAWFEQLVKHLLPTTGLEWRGR